MCGYGNAQYLQQTGQYPTRCEISKALSGEILDRDTFVRFHSEIVALLFVGGIISQTLNESPAPFTKV